MMSLRIDDIEPWFVKRSKLYSAWRWQIEADPKKDKYDEAKLGLVNDMMEKYTGLLQELGIILDPHLEYIFLHSPFAEKMTLGDHSKPGAG